MKRAFVLFCIFLFITSCSGHPGFVTEPENVVTFKVNLLDREADQFKVTAMVENLSPDNNIFQFAATAPGTYQTMDIGRFVRSFQAFDRDGNELTTDQISTNQWRFSEPEKVARIEYAIAETWDTTVDSNRIYAMCGTSIEDDHVLINGQAVFGYFKGMQASDIHVELNYPENWSVGTALKKNQSQHYVATSFDHIVDSPILLGELTTSSTNMQGTTVDIFTYSKTGMIQSDELLDAMSEMLDAASDFTGGLPVDRYVFLFHFENRSAGAWEHSYSSTYIYREAKFEDLKDRLLKTAAHEFFHIVTPLNIHSEIIETFDFETPTASQHLWLYEGTTEWAAQIMLLRDSIRTLDEYLQVLRRKIMLDAFYFDPEYSLRELSLNSFSQEGQRQYGNIYQRGALVSGLLDIRLLELSNGKMGLRELINELAKDYGPAQPFDEATFFDEIVERTYPEIATFIENYIINSEPLPLREYFGKLGIHYYPQKDISDDSSRFGVNEGEYVITSIDSSWQATNAKVGDHIASINNGDIAYMSMYRLRMSMSRSDSLDELPVQLKRDGELIDLTGENGATKAFVENFVTSYFDLSNQAFHVFEVDKNPTEAQLELRQKWQVNM